MKAARVKDVDSYIDSFPKGTQRLLRQLRAAIRKAAPKAEEMISYNMPAYKFNGMLAYFSGFQKHIGFYPFRSAINKFMPKLEKYKTSAGTVQFPLDRDIPAALVTGMIKFRAKENIEKQKIKALKKKKKN